MEIATFAVSHSTLLADIDAAATFRSGVVVDVAAFKVSHSVLGDHDATAMMAHGVVMDVTAFKVCHSVVLDIDATAHSRFIVMNIAGFEVSHSIGPDIDTTAVAPLTNVVMDIAAYKVSHSVRADKDATTISAIALVHEAADNVQPNQLGVCTRRYEKDSAPTLGIEHRTSGHLRLNSQGAVDADRPRSMQTRSADVHGPRAHVAGQVVRARRNQDRVDRAVADGGGELSYAAHQDLASSLRRRLLLGLLHGSRLRRRLLIGLLQGNSLRHCLAVCAAHLFVGTIVG
mmetsp:Transcript_27577/g.69841  ORF Transcript_27577/g.69841 Transcript_27577/m.69841 type:complete len:287 (-) Transcript_27577:3-863(-)